MPKKLYKIVEEKPTEVIVKINDLTTLDIAKNPFLQATYDYVNIRQGRDVFNYSCTIIKKDGTTFHYTWGNSESLVGKQYWDLRDSIMNFVFGEGKGIAFRDNRRYLYA